MSNDKSDPNLKDAPRCPIRPKILQSKTNNLLVPIKLLPRCSLSFRHLRAGRTRPPFDSAPNIPRRLRSVLSNHAASTTSSARASTSTSRQTSEHAASPFRLLLLIQTRSLRRSHFLREQVLLVACRVVRRHGGLRVNRAEVVGCGYLGRLGTSRRGGVCGFCGRVVDLWRRRVHGVQGAGESAALACSRWRWDAACLRWWDRHCAWLGRRRNGIL